MIVMAFIPPAIRWIFANLVTCSNKVNRHQAFIQDLTSGRVGQVKGHVSLERFWGEKQGLLKPPKASPKGVTKPTINTNLMARIIVQFGFNFCISKKNNGISPPEIPSVGVESLPWMKPPPPPWMKPWTCTHRQLALTSTLSLLWGSITCNTSLMGQL